MRHRVTLGRSVRSRLEPLTDDPHRSRLDVAIDGGTDDGDERAVHLPFSPMADASTGGLALLIEPAAEVRGVALLRGTRGDAAAADRARQE